MPPKRTVRTRSAARLLVAGAVAVAHLWLLLLASTWQRPEPAPAAGPPQETYSAIPVESAAASAPLTKARKQGRVRKKLLKHQPPVPGPPSAAAAISRWTLRAPNGAAAGAPAANGQFGRDAPDDFAVREALRTSVGCDMEGLKLRPDEQDRCNDRTGKWAKKGRRIGPAGDDPKRAAELAAQEDYIRRYNQWKSTDSGIHNGKGMLDAKGALGAMPPKRNADVPPPPDIPE